MLETVELTHQIIVVIIFFLIMGLCMGALAGWMSMHFRSNSAYFQDCLDHHHGQIKTVAGRIDQMLEKITTVSHECNQLRCDMDARELYSDAADPHLLAINSARTGASIDYIVENYQLIKAEAELIVSMHGNPGV